ncbi:hypothetical protein K504DRAFT_485168 [Pleomassaria siparia CBS 279.74]|uniref:PLC-like phosphodiesterase n=1 Tax=Pleomassaria siparia CBS 279.74 TaxID=1314801 RepID=A0A6G1JVG1_9PLEO|nr:hypothetical protein K504DRAFT_485168 [Pleomassaria siparia CBS 279.74]
MHSPETISKVFTATKSDADSIPTSTADDLLRVIESWATNSAIFYLLTTARPHALTYDHGFTLDSSRSIAALNATASSTFSKPLMTIARTSTSTTSSILPHLSKDQQPCNGHIELCSRRFSNVTMVVAHNSPFVKRHNIASNQDVHVLTQLNDGIRGLQFSVYKPATSSKLRLCHQSCEILDVGTLETYLKTVARWIEDHPYEVISIIIANANRVDPTEFQKPFQTSGLVPRLYIPPSPTMALDHWPRLSEMIITNNRVVVTLDYEANQTKVPWLLDEFSYRWQTPFSPINPTFPCTAERPPKQNNSVSMNKMYMANHNLNVPLPFGAEFLQQKHTSTSSPHKAEPIFIPGRSHINQVNAVKGYVSLGRSVDDCTSIWGRPPNLLLVDYYSRGDFNGSVFQVAATANNVSYNRTSCCGMEKKSAAHWTKFTRLEKSFFYIGFPILVVTL